MTSVSQQKNYFSKAAKSSAETDLLFLEMVQGGMKKRELQKNIERNPELWERYTNWLEKLPD